MTAIAAAKIGRWIKKFTILVPRNHALPRQAHRLYRYRLQHRSLP